MTRYAKLTIFMVTVLVLVSAGFMAGKKSGAQSTTSTTSAAPVNGPFYLAMGASSSLGIQPTGVPAHNGRQTTDGYTNDFVKKANAKYPKA